MLSKWFFSSSPKNFPISLKIINTENFNVLKRKKKRTSATLSRNFLSSPRRCRFSRFPRRDLIVSPRAPSTRLPRSESIQSWKFSPAFYSSGIADKREGESAVTAAEAPFHPEKHFLLRRGGGCSRPGNPKALSFFLPFYPSRPFWWVPPMFLQG